MNAAPSSPLADDLADRLVAAIAVGEFLPGTRLPAERDLAVQLGVGRTTVRAALARVQGQGLIETQRGRGGGSFVREQWTASSHGAVLRVLDQTWPATVDRLEAMRRLHGTIARAAAERRDEDDVAVLLDRLEAYRDAPSGRGKQLADAALHDAITVAAHNDALRALLERVEGGIGLGSATHLWGEPEGMAASERRATAEHAALVAAIRAGRADDADRIAREHGRIDRELLEAARRRAAGDVTVGAAR